MSLIVSFISENEIEEPNTGLFGFESWRTTLWGSAVIKNLGCEMLATLQEDDLFVTGRHVSILKEELLIIKENASMISAAIEFIDTESILFRVENALGFIEVAASNESVLGISIT